MMLIDPKLLEQLEGSTCFGIAHDEKAKECSLCDLQAECSAKTASNSVFDHIKVLKPETEEAMRLANEKKKAKDADVDEEGLTARQRRKKRKRELKEKIGMPETKGMTVEELWALLEEKGGTCPIYDEPSVQKMRLVMSIKECYVRAYEEKYGKLED